MAKPDRELQFLHWLGKAAEFNKTMKGKQMLDPATLTPETLYELQSETWAQGAAHEQNRIIELLDRADSACSGWAIELIKGETE